jgi:hypothetical protein
MRITVLTTGTMQPGNGAKRIALHISNTEGLVRKPRTLLSCMGGFSGIGKKKHDKNDTFCVCFCVTQRDDAMGEWIPVSERLPDEEVRVLATDGTDVFDSEYMSGNWEWCADVTHWMPLPEPPEVK